MKESDLYPPLKRFLESLNYEVKGEVRGCDALAVRGGEEPVAVELKLVLNLDVILQAADRLSMTPYVYICVPKQCSVLRRSRKRVIKLLRMLGLGLIAADASAGEGGAKVLLDPGGYKPRISKVRRERLLGEFAKRTGDPNAGGSDMKRGIMTAYRQRALAVARFLMANGPAKASHVAKSLQEPKARNIMYRNVYGWFDRVSLGVYGLSPRGLREVPLWPAETDRPASRSPPRRDMEPPNRTGSVPTPGKTNLAKRRAAGPEKRFSFNYRRTKPGFHRIPVCAVPAVPPSIFMQISRECQRVPSLPPANPTKAGCFEADVPRSSIQPPVGRAGRAVAIRPAPCTTGGWIAFRRLGVWNLRPPLNANKK